MDHCTFSIRVTDTATSVGQMSHMTYVLVLMKMSLGGGPQGVGALVGVGCQCSGSGMDVHMSIAWVVWCTTVALVSVG